MNDSLLSTKFYIHTVRSPIVKRDRLIGQLNQNIRHKLILISAPAGFGKTTLVGEWCRQTDLPVAWLSLDTGDNDPLRFWTYLVTAVQKFQDELGETSLAMLRSSKSTQAEFFLTPLINEIARLPYDFVLVLDDYHLIEAQPIHNALCFLLNHLPAQMHLIIVSRCDPPFPLARFRGRAELKELRAADLRFTSEEANLFVHQVMNLQVSPEQVEALQMRTEGWIVGLQLASLSLGGSQDVSAFIESLQGTQRYILDYLTEEVLEQQPEYLKSFLLKTSILERMCPALCDAIMEGEKNFASSTQILEHLEQANLFLVSLDDECRCYRYHHLFGELLRHYLQRCQPKQVSTYHRRAAQWFERNGLEAEALKHALAVDDFQWAANLIENGAGKLIVDSQFTTLLNQLEALPNHIILSRPWLCVYHGWVFWFTSGDINAAAQRLQDAENAVGVEELGKKQINWTNLPSITEAEEFWGHIATLRSFIAQAEDLTTAIRLSQTALSIVPQPDYWLRSMVLMNLGASYYLLDEFELAEPILKETFAASCKCDRIDGISLEFVGKISESAVSSLCLRAHLQALRGNLSVAIALSQEARELASKRHWLGIAPGLIAQNSLGQFLRERNQLDTAAIYLTQGIELASQSNQLVLIHSYLELALVRHAQGDKNGAWSAIQGAEAVKRSTKPVFVFHLPTFITIDMCKVRLWLMEGNIDQAVAWAESSGLGVDDKLSYRNELDYLTLARVLVAQGSFSNSTQSEHLVQAMDLLQRLQQAIEAGKRTARLMEVLILQALVYQAGQEMEQSLSLLEQALSLGRLGGYIRIFVDKGAPMLTLLRHAASRGIYPHYVSQLLAAFAHRDGSEPGIIQPLIEPLSQRELEVLQHLAGGLSNQEISDRLIVSLATVKWHTSRIYGKLGVKNRSQAVVKARELGILE